MTRALLDAAMLLAYGAVAGGAGWWAHQTVDEWRMRRLLARLHDQLDTHPATIDH